MSLTCALQGQLNNLPTDLSTESVENRDCRCYIKTPFTSWNIQRGFRLIAQPAGDRLLQVSANFPATFQPQPHIGENHQ